MKKNEVVRIISSLLIFLFFYAALSKLWAFDVFKFQLGGSPFIDRLAGLTAWSLPLGELMVGFALLINRTRFLGLIASLFLMAMFSAYIYAMLNFSYYTPCSCGGLISLMGWHTHLYFNLTFVALIIFAILIYEPQERTLFNQINP